MSQQPDPPQRDGPTRFEPIVPARPDRLRGASARTVSGARHQADRGYVQAVRWLSLVLALLVVTGAVPAWGHLNVAAAPGWARLILLVALLQLAYLAWMAISPDWSTVWVVMVVFAVVAAFCALATAVAVATPADRALPLGLDAVREKMARWCVAALLLNVLGTYLCGRTSVRWRRSCRRAFPTDQ